jgi:hypothetical protein
MTNSDREKWVQHFKQNYPLEYSLAFETMVRFNDIAQDIYSNTHILPRKIEFILAVNEQTKNPELVMQEVDGMILLAAISRVVIQNILSVLDSPEQVERKLMDRAKKCLLAQTQRENSKITKCSVISCLSSMLQLLTIFEEKNRRCYNCGYLNDIDANYCGKCRNKL